MAEPFSFGFSGGDIEIDEEENIAELRSSLPERHSADTALVVPRAHTFEELLATLPSKLSYNILKIDIKYGRQIKIPRRELFDIRMQLMAEDSNPEDCDKRDPLLAGLNDNDIEKNVYEGGLKSWECSVDLAKFVVDNMSPWRQEGEELRVMELGCGTALPTLCLFQETLTQSRNILTHFTLADYNIDVLRLVTFPNIFLSWALINTYIGMFNESEGDLEITPGLLDSFVTTLLQNNITLSFLSGAWGPQFTALVPAKAKPTLILASETIYSLASLSAFAQTLVELLRRDENSDRFPPERRALVAAKMVYFGVGGGVQEFLRLLRECDKDDVVDQERYVADTSEVSRNGGVPRVILDLVGECRLEY